MQSHLSLLNLIEAHIAGNPFHGIPDNLYSPLNYILSLGGKRIRPVLTLMGCELFSEQPQKALDAAMAVEIFHNFSLIHDDIMDHAPIRRGHPTVHEKWNMATAILSGDLMLAKAYEYVFRTDVKYHTALFEVFSKTVTQICEGQQLDMNFATQHSVTESEYLEMIRLKTAVLLGCALKMGAIMADANKQEQEKIYLFGMYLGLGFQLMDDYLDAFGDSERIGKQPGGDILEGKKTILILEASRNNSAILDYIGINSNLTDTERITAATEIIRQTGADKYLLNLSDSYFKQAEENLDAVRAPEESKKELRELSMFLKSRNF